MKKISPKPKAQKKIRRGKADIWKSKALVHVDLGCGENKRPGSIGVDFRKLRGVDIVQNLTIFPWLNVPSEIADVAMSSHLLEHINPDSPDPRLAGLLDLMLEKKMLTKQEVDKYVGEYKFLGGFIRFMDEVWRIMKPGGQFHSVFPYAASPGYWQDPTHVNPITPTTLNYFDPLAKNEAGQLMHLYTIYRPKPWNIVRIFYDQNGFIEVTMEKRKIDKSYGTLDDGLEDKKLKS